MNALIADTVHLMYSFFQTHHIVLILHVLRLCFIIYRTAGNIGGQLNLAFWRSGKRSSNLNPSNLSAIYANKGMHN